MLNLYVESQCDIKSESFMLIICIQPLIPPTVLSPTPTVSILGDSTKVIFLFGKLLTKVEAVIHPAVPPPTTTISFIDKSILQGII